MGQINGVVVGLVRSLDDPQNLGRIEVHLPWLSDNNRSYWARVATLMAGAGRGSWFMPEPDDEVLLAFDHGDVQHPYVVGFLWNGKDKPPNDDGIDRKVRRLRTVSGHVLEFHDKAGEEKILIKTKAGQEMELEDTQNSITIKTKTSSGAQVKLEDSPGKVTIQTTAGANKIEISDSGINLITTTSVKITAPAGLSITSGGSLSITCGGSANLTAASLNVTAASTIFSGMIQASMVQTPVLQSAAVISSSYTPGLGNLI